MRVIERLKRLFAKPSIGQPERFWVVCAWCGWEMQRGTSTKTVNNTSHGMCPECVQVYYPPEDSQK